MDLPEKVAFELFIEKLWKRLEIANLSDSESGDTIAKLKHKLSRSVYLSTHEITAIEEEFLLFCPREIQKQISELMDGDFYFEHKCSHFSRPYPLNSYVQVKDINLKEKDTCFPPSNRIIEIQLSDQKLVIDLKKIYHTVVFEGGGAKGLVYPAVTAGLDEKHLLDDVVRFGGSSAGAINAFICALGYRGQALEKIADSIDTNILLDRQMLEKGGYLSIAQSTIQGATIKRAKREGEYYINTGNNLLMKAREIIKNRFEGCYQKASDPLKHQMEEQGIKANMDRNRITFSDLKYMISLFPDDGFKELVITGTQMCGFSGCIAGQSFFNIIDTPHAEIALAVRISASIPYVFKRQRYLGQYYVDGGVTQNLPLDFFMNREEFKGEILAFTFNRPTKKVKESPNPTAKHLFLATAAGGNLNVNDWAEFSFENQTLQQRAKDFGVDFFTVEQGALDTMSFDADFNTIIKPAREHTKAKFHDQFSKSGSRIPKNLSTLSVAQLEHTIIFLQNPDYNHIIFNIEGRPISSIPHLDNLKKEVLSLLKNELIKRTVAQPVYAKDGISPAIISSTNSQSAFFTDLNRYVESRSDCNIITGYSYANEKVTNPFSWLYQEINDSAQQAIDPQTRDWHYDLLKFASPIDIILNSGIVALDNVILYRSEKSALDSCKQQFFTRTKFLTDLSEKIAHKYCYSNAQQLKDATGEYLKEKHSLKHITWFRAQSPENIQQVLSSPLIIKDIFAINRMDDLNAIEYGEHITRTPKRSSLVTAFKNEITSGNPRWLHDLLICCQLFDNFFKDNKLQARFAIFEKKQPARQAFSKYLEHVYRYGFSINLNDKNWQGKCSAVVKLFTNTKLTSTDSNVADHQGRIDIILRDFGNEVACYFKGLRHDIKRTEPESSFANVLDLPVVHSLINKTAPAQLDSFKTTIDDRKNTWQVYFCKVKAERLNFNPVIEPQKSSNNSPDYLDIQAFDENIYNENQSVWTRSTGLSERKHNLQNLCNYVNEHPQTWYDDLFGVNSAFEFKENPLLVLLCSSNISDKTAITIIGRLEEFHFYQLNGSSKIDSIPISLSASRNVFFLSKTVITEETTEELQLDGAPSKQRPQ